MKSLTNVQKLEIKKHIQKPLEEYELGNYYNHGFDYTERKEYPNVHSFIAAHYGKEIELLAKLYEQMGDMEEANFYRDSLV